MKRSSLSFLELLKKFCTQTEGRERERGRENTEEGLLLSTHER